jgi:hypothetical protein
VSASISEFERTKPTKTFVAFKAVLKKYRKLSDVHYPNRTFVMVVNDLEELFDIFKSGE